MKTLILDYSKWRCGRNGKNKLGKGETFLCNKSGYMCCLGQFSPQLNIKVKKEDLKFLAIPSDLSKEIPFLTSFYHFTHRDSDLSRQAININDDTKTTPEEKIKLLRELFKEYGLIIRVINRKKLAA